MAMIKCSLKKDGRLHVVEVLEFQKGDTIAIERSKEDIKRTLSPDLAGIIPCPGTGGKRKDPGPTDCWLCVTSFDRNQVVVKKRE